MSSLDNLAMEVNQLQSSLETFCLHTLNRIQSLKTKIETVTLQHQNFQLGQNSDFRFTTLSVE